MQFDFSYSKLLGNIILFIVKEVIVQIQSSNKLSYKDFEVTRKIRLILRNYFYTVLYYNKPGGKTKHDQQALEKVSVRDFYGVRECFRKAKQIADGVSLYA